MSTLIRKYSSQIIIVLISIILLLMLIMVTDMHVAKIDQQIHETIHPEVYNEAYESGEPGRVAIYTSALDG